MHHSFRGVTQATGTSGEEGDSTVEQTRRSTEHGWTMRRAVRIVFQKFWRRIGYVRAEAESRAASPPKPEVRYRLLTMTSPNVLPEYSASEHKSGERNNASCNGSTRENTRYTSNHTPSIWRKSAFTRAAARHMRTKRRNVCTTPARLSSTRGRRVRPINPKLPNRALKLT